MPLIGTVFEKRLILKYIEEEGKEPGTNDELHPDDLLDVKTGRIVRPRPPNFTSLPSLLKAFQDEWDALVLETYNTREQLARTREELATALYQHDAAVRVIARLSKERDEARDALSKVTVAPSGGGSNDDAMAVDGQSLPEELVAHVEGLHAAYVCPSPNAPNKVLTMLQINKGSQEAPRSRGLGVPRRCRRPSTPPAS